MRPGSASERRRKDSREPSQRTSFAETDDVKLLSEASSVQPWTYAPQLDGWHVVAEQFVKAGGVQKGAVSCRQRFNHLMRKHRTQLAASLRRGGHAQPVTAKQRLMDDVLELMDGHQASRSSKRGQNEGIASGALKAGPVTRNAVLDSEVSDDDDDDNDDEEDYVDGQRSNRMRKRRRTSPLDTVMEAIAGSEEESEKYLNLRREELQVRREELQLAKEQLAAQIAAQQDYRNQIATNQEQTNRLIELLISLVRARK